MKAINRKYHFFDAKEATIGRLATQVATILRGKNKVDFTPHIDGGDFVVIINSDQIGATGAKAEGKIYYRYSGYPGGITATKLKDQIKKDSRKVLHHAVYSMLPKNKLRDKMIKRLLIYRDENHKHKIDVKH
jgi:large subunit ribosomal protein L13